VRSLTDQTSPDRSAAGKVRSRDLWTLAGALAFHAPQFRWAAPRGKGLAVPWGHVHAPVSNCAIVLW